MKLEEIMASQWGEAERGRGRGTYPPDVILDDFGSIRNDNTALHHKRCIIRESLLKLSQNAQSEMQAAINIPCIY
jgi:hypothetical protein